MKGRFLISCMGSTLCLVLGCEPTSIGDKGPGKTPTQTGAIDNRNNPQGGSVFQLPKEIRAVWLTHYEYMKASETQWAAWADDLVKSGVNTVHLAMYADAKPLWNSEVYRKATGTQLSEDWAKKLVPVFRNRGLRVGAWFEYGLAAGASNSPLVLQHPDWLSRDSSQNIAGNEDGMVFLSPASSGAMEYIVNLVKELTQNYEWDEVQLDRFRYTRASMDGREFGYESGALDRFWTAFGVKGTPPQKDDAQWVRYREQLISAVVKRAYSAVKSVRPSVVVSSAPVGFYGIQQHLQKWEDWLCGGFLDYVVPQIYEKTLDSFQAHFEKLYRIAESCGKQDRFSVGVDGSAANDSDLVESQIRYARSRGVMHASLWVYHTYSGQVSIRDNLDTMRMSGHVWEK